MDITYITDTEQVTCQIDTDKWIEMRHSSANYIWLEAFEGLGSLMEWVTLPLSRQDAGELAAILQRYADTGELTEEE